MIGFYDHHILHQSRTQRSRTFHYYLCFQIKDGRMEILMKKNDVRHAFVILILLVLNSILYPTIESAVNSNDSIWNLSAYVFFFLFLIKCVSLYEKYSIKSKFSLIGCLGISLVITFNGFLMSTTLFLSRLYFVCLAFQVVLSIVNIVLFRRTCFNASTLMKRNISDVQITTSSEEVSSYLMNNNDTCFKKIFFSSTFVVLSAIVAITNIIIVNVVRYTDANNKIVPVIFAISVILFVIFDELKFVYYKQFKLVVSFIELFVNFVFIGGAYYINSTYYRSTLDIDFLPLTLPVIAYVPYLITSKRILIEYRKLANKINRK